MMEYNDDIAHGLQNRLDQLKDNLTDIRTHSKEWQEWKRTGKDKTTLYRLKLACLEIERIRDDIPCSCGEQNEPRLCGGIEDNER